MDLYKLVFAGDILPGHEATVVRERLLALLKLAPAHAHQLFSGRPVTLRRGLDAEQAQVYRRKLAAMGVGVRVEADAAAGPPPARQPAAEPGASTLELVPTEPAPVERMACPECGHHQPRRTLCQACGLDMPRFLAAKARQEEETRRPATTAAEGTPHIRSDASLALEHAEAPRLLGFGLDGRISRRSYVTGSALMMTAMFWALYAAFELGSPVMMGVGVLILVLFGLRLSVLRCHDFDWRGWWVLIAFVPYVGTLFSLLLTFLPGSGEENSFGPRPTPTGWAATIGAIALSAVSFWGLTSVLPYTVAQATEMVSGGGDEQALLAGYDPALNDLVMYSRRGCGHCASLRARFDRLGVRYVPVDLDDDPVAAEALEARLMATDAGGTTPGLVIEINGTLLADNPSLEQVAEHFYRRRSGDW